MEDGGPDATRPSLPDREVLCRKPLAAGRVAGFLIQGTAVLAAIVYSGVASFVLLKAIALVVPLRATENEEASGLDIPMHGEEAYMHIGGMEMITPAPSSGFETAPAKSPAVSTI